MKVFNYKVRLNNSKKIIKGTLSSENRQNCIAQLKEQGYTIIQVKENTSKINWSALATAEIVSVKKKDICEFFDQLGFMLYAGMSMYHALETLKTCSTNKAMVHLVGPIAEDVKYGMSFDEALSRSKYIDEATVSQIKAGIDSGDTPKTLDRIVKAIKKELELKSKVITASVYPAFIFTVMIVAMVALMIFVVPTIAKTLVDMGGEMPALTLGVIGLSEFMSKYIAYIVIVIIIMVGTHITLCKRVYKYRFLIHKLTLKIPIIGDIILKLNLVSLCRSLADLQSCGITLSKSLKITSKVMTNEVMIKRVEDVTNLVEVHGLDLSNALERVGGFPSLMSQLILVGVSSGSLTEVLEKIAGQYERDVDNLIARATSMMEPLMMVLIGALVGTVVISMFLPMFSLLDAI